jgi:hypothetical protein
MNKIAKTIRLFSRGARKIVTRPDEAWLLLRMAWWVAVLSVTARFYSLPRALQIVAGTSNETQSALGRDEQELAGAIDLLLSADFLMFKPVCWKRAAVLHRYLSRNGVATRDHFRRAQRDWRQGCGHAWLERDGRAIFERRPPGIRRDLQFS